MSTEDKLFSMLTNIRAMYATQMTESAFTAASLSLDGSVGTTITEVKYISVTK